MNRNETVISTALLAATCMGRAASPGDAPQLPFTGARIVNLATEAQLQTAIDNLQHGDTVLLANGTYALTRSLYVNGRNNVTIRGTTGSTNVVLVGKGMNNANHGDVPFGIWSNSTNTTIAHLTIRDTWDNEIIFNSGAQSPRVYCVRLMDAGSQFIKSNPTDVNAGLGVNGGVIEHCWFEYTGSPPNDHGAGAGYFNGISAHAARNWIVRGNLFKNLHNPDGTAYPWNPSVLFWRHSSGTVTERNIFINVDRAIAYGLENTTAFFDHAGGVIRNNFVYLEPGLMSASRKASSDGTIIAWNSPDTQVDHNTALVAANVFYAVEFRFPATTNTTARNNLADAPIRLRDNAKTTQTGNLLNATPGMFVNPAAGDLHLISAATNAIDQASPLGTVTDDFDGERRPHGARSDIGADEFPTNARPRITSFLKAGSNCVIRFSTVLGMSYDVQGAEDLANGDWLIVDAGIPGSGGVMQSVDAGVASSMRFYRIRLSP